VISQHQFGLGRVDGSPTLRHYRKRKAEPLSQRSRPKEETPKEFDPTSEKSSVGENPLEYKFEHSKGTLTASRGRTEAGEAIAKGDPEITETGLEITSNDIPRNAEACTG
jgi:hypothetical protein